MSALIGKSQLLRLLLKFSFLHSLLSASLGAQSAGAFTVQGVISFSAAFFLLIVVPLLERELAGGGGMIFVSVSRAFFANSRFLGKFYEILFIP